MTERVCIVGLDEPEYAQIRQRVGIPVIAQEVIPKIIVKGGELLVQPPNRMTFIPVSKVVFHGIYDVADDMDFITGLAMWGGPCLPNAYAMLDCRLKLPCLARAMRCTRFPIPERGFVAAGTSMEVEIESVAKWGNWHCGENKTRFTELWTGEFASVIEPFLPGQSVRVVIIGDQSWQIRLEGENWLKSIHDARAAFMEIDPELLADTQHIRQSFGLEIIANDYIVAEGGSRYLLEVNHIPNVTRFPEIWDAYRDYVVAWING
jgi:hypothetical protein